MRQQRSHAEKRERGKTQRNEAKGREGGQGRGSRWKEGAEERRRGTRQGNKVMERGRAVRRRNEAAGGSRGSKGSDAAVDHTASSPYGDPSSVPAVWEPWPLESSRSCTEQKQSTTVGVRMSLLRRWSALLFLLCSLRFATGPPVPCCLAHTARFQHAHRDASPGPPLTQVPHFNSHTFTLSRGPDFHTCWPRYRRILRCSRLEKTGVSWASSETVNGTALS